MDFEVKELGTLPEGLYFVGATGGPDWVDLHYEYPDRLAGGIGILVEASGSTYTLFYFFQNQEDPLTKEELIAVAESMTTEAVDQSSFRRVL